MEPDAGQSRGNRRIREFTTSETLALHPIILLFDRPEVQEVLSLRRESCLRFADFQFLLTAEPPRSVLKDCPKDQHCRECEHLEKCLHSVPGLWESKFSDTRLEKIRMYSKKSHLADDLRRLVSERFLVRVRRGNYELSDDREVLLTKLALRKYLGRRVEGCPAEKVHLSDWAYLLYMDDELAEESKADLEEIGLLANQVRIKLGEIQMRGTLTQIAKAFKKGLSKLKKNKDKVYLKRYLRTHIEIQLANLGLSEEPFKVELDGIHSIDLNISETELKNIEAEIESEEEMVREVKKEISRAFWLGRETGSWAEKYESLVAREGKPSRAKVNMIKRILERDQDFMERFRNSDMCIRPDVLDNCPVLVIEHTPVVPPKPKGGSGRV
jgi:hypothetical protein